MLQRRLLPNTPALLAFDAVARTGNFTAAARDLGQTQGAVSRQVAQLEGQLGVALVTRGARAARLTEAGAAYARAVRSALDTLGQGAMEALGQTPEPGLHLAILPTFGTRWLMPRIPRFVRRHPEITLHVTTRIGQFDLAGAGIDAAIHSGRGDWPGARLTLLMEERVIPVAAPGTPGVAGQPLLALATRPQAWPDWWAHSGQRGALPAPSMRLEQVATLAQAAAAGMGVALMPAFLIRPELDSGALVPLGPETSTGFGYWFVEPDATPKPATAHFKDWLLTETDRDTVV
ncbi:LysR family transcriptional regulator [Rhodobacter sp. NTK016B]|uniref:LysR substrate-binding domain-containing protein n=1 Tax=Rhodobacter sp. NTK016B TaxID=2759676 RepID=UPI001A905CDE|nr:LysR substrate-binding domain-containing protein [Rhodobacter sp. NTK016B]MBN8293863.1 LysR family transcriptional regulator [Rhodobacter sp. NTK016B]